MSMNALNELSQVYLDNIAVDEAKVDTGKSADEKATARNQRNNPKKGDPGFGKFATSVFITRKDGESLATGKDSAASRKRREAHAAKRGVKKEEVLDELKKTTYGSYIKKASKDLADRSFDHGESEKRQHEPDASTDREEKKLKKRQQGISRAADRLTKESFSNWRDELREIADDVPETDVEMKKKIDIKKNINNKIKILPKMAEAIEELGGQLLEVVETETPPEKPKIDPAQKRQSLLKKQVLLKKLQAVRQGAGQDITASYEPDIEDAVEYFYEEGINEEGIDLLIEEIGLEEFVDFVDGGAVELNEERKARKMNVRSLKATKKKAEEIKADKSDVVKKAGPKDTLSRARSERTFKKPKLAKPTPKSKKDYDGDGKKETPKQEHRGVRNKQITQAVKKVKPAQPKKPASKEGIRAKVKSVYDAGVKRHRKATQPIRVFHKGMKQAPKAIATAAKKVKGVLDANKKKTVNMQSYEPEGDLISEKDLNAAERRALPDKEFALPGKGKGPEGKQAGSYPIPDKNHARMALAMVAKHGTPEKKAKVRAAVAKKFPDIKQETTFHDIKNFMKENEAYKKTVKDLKAKFGTGVLASKQDFEDHKKREAAKPKPKPQVQKPLTDAEKAQKEVDAQYGGAENRKKGYGLGS